MRATLWRATEILTLLIGLLPWTLLSAEAATADGVL